MLDTNESNVGKAKIINLKTRAVSPAEKTSEKPIRVLDEEKRKSNEVAFHERLTQLKSTFLEIRQNMKVGENVGFGMLPDLHIHFSMGRLVPMRRTEDNHWEYARDEFMQIDWIRLPEEQEKNIIVPPENTADRMWLVSLYQYDPNPTFGVDERAINLDQSTWEGIMAHEFAHMFFLGTEPPAFLADFQQQRERDHKEAFERHDPNVWEDFDDTTESTIDVIAARMGYKTQILDKLRYMQEFLRTFKDMGGTVSPLAKTPEQGIKSLIPRVKEVMRYS